MKRILFVDDEPNVLQGLRRMLRSLRNEWVMDFADGGVAALELFEAHEYDVVVTDMRMPGMDGAELLARVLDLSPTVARIVLSGHAEQSAAVRAAGIAHQVLAKPCDAEQLRSTVSRTCRLRERLSNRVLLEKVTSMVRLPSLPAVYEEVLTRLNSSDSTVTEIGESMSKDIGMSAKILQLVNSAFFGMRQQIDSVVQATNLLGIDVIRDLVLSNAVFQVFESDKSPISLERVWRHSLAVGCIAREIAADLQLPKAVASEAAQAAILHDAGLIAMATRLGDEYAEVVRGLAAGKSDVDAEREVFGCAHPEIGGSLLGLWGLPDSVVEAVTFHHAPEEANESTPGPVAVVYAADRLVHAYDHQVDPEVLADELAVAGVADKADKWWQTTSRIMGNEETTQ